MTDIDRISLGDRLQIHVKNGRMEAEVTAKYPVNEQIIMQGD